jgi:hypothetical protein
VSATLADMTQESRALSAGWTLTDGEPALCVGSGQRVAFPGLAGDCPECGRWVNLDPYTFALDDHYPAATAPTLSMGL